MKSKVFMSTKKEYLQKELDEWLELNKNLISIKFSTHSNSGTNIYSVLIIYNEAKNENT